MARFLFVWRNALASEEGPAHPHDRHVGLTASLYMSSDGLRCWPSQDTLALRTGLTDRSVGRALKRLCDTQWLSRKPRKSPRGIPHKRFGYEYQARLPKRLANAYANGERGSLFNGRNPAKVGKFADLKPAPTPLPPGAGFSNSGAEQKNGERDDKRIPNAVRTNSVEELAKSDAVIKEGSSFKGLEASFRKRVDFDFKLADLERRLLDGELSDAEFVTEVEKARQVTA